MRCIQFQPKLLGNCLSCPEGEDVVGEVATLQFWSKTGHPPHKFLIQIDLDISGDWIPELQRVLWYQTAQLIRLATLQLIFSYF